jgi:hypothetical protein
LGRAFIGHANTIGHATVLPSFKWTWKSLCNHATISTKFSFGYYSKTI